MEVVSYGNNANLNDLSGWKDAFDFGFLFENREVYEAAQIIQNELCYNDKKSRFTCSIDLSQVRDILHSYIEVTVKNPQMPYYDTKAGANQIKTIYEVAKKSTQNDLLVSRVLKQLYYSTKQNRIKTTAILYPRDTEMANDTRNSGMLGPLKVIGNGIYDATGKIVVGASEGITGTLTGVAKLLKYLPYVVIVGGAVVATYYGSQIYNNFQRGK